MSVRFYYKREHHFPRDGASMLTHTASVWQPGTFITVCLEVRICAYHSMEAPPYLFLAYAMCYRRQAFILYTELSLSDCFRDLCHGPEFQYFTNTNARCISKVQSAILSIRMARYCTLSAASRVEMTTSSSLLGLTRYAPRMAHRAVPDISASLQPHLLPRSFVSATALPISLGILSGLFPT